MANAHDGGQTRRDVTRRGDLQTGLGETVGEKQSTHRNLDRVERSNSYDGGLVMVAHQHPSSLVKLERLERSRIDIDDPIVVIP
ncbi:MAG: hypothetical protein AAF715_17310 [Myxococcota bacterium]